MLLRKKQPVKENSTPGAGWLTKLSHPWSVRTPATERPNQALAKKYSTGNAAGS
ncbi:MAG: hypothetical protein ABI760_25385 [Ferruginibacter sp.]